MPYQASSGEVTVALAGDAMITRALKPFTEPEFLALRELLRSADAAFANGEMALVAERTVERGRLTLATGAAAKEALDQFAALSAPFGVTIEARDGLGVVRL